MTHEVPTHGCDPQTRGPRADPLTPAPEPGDQAEPRTNWFELLDEPPRYDLDLEGLRRRYLLLGRATHPDRVRTSDERERLEAIRRSALLNRAFQVLSDPVRRAEHLLELCGGPTAEQDRSVPGDLLARTLMLREELEQAEASQDRQALERLRQELRRELDGVLQRVAELARGLPGSRELRRELRAQLNSINYYRRLLDGEAGAPGGAS